VRWDDDSIERILRADAIDNLLRVAHADSLGPDGRRTNLENLQALEALDFVEHGSLGEKETRFQSREGEASVRPHDTSNVY